MQEHNPYAAPKAPVADETAPENAFAAGEEVEYGGFWRRVGAHILDSLILAPLAILVYFGAQFSPLFYVIYVIPGILVALFYSVYLVKRYGGTPGKRILDLRIVMADGSPVTGSAAMVRYSVMLVLSTIPSVGMAFASMNVSTEGYDTLGFFERMQLIEASTPSWSLFGSYAIWGWIILCVIVMLVNPQRRAVHDFMAKTLVIRT
jgi:uncharacterized RDD family membrane protein YckC